MLVVYVADRKWSHKVHVRLAASRTFTVWGNASIGKNDQQRKNADPAEHLLKVNMKLPPLSQSASS